MPKKRTSGQNNTQQRQDDYESKNKNFSHRPLTLYKKK